MKIIMFFGMFDESWYIFCFLSGLLFLFRKNKCKLLTVVLFKRGNERKKYGKYLRRL